MTNPPDFTEDYRKGKLLLINKPRKWTSFDVVHKIHNLTRSKVGHAGTLDPLATGLLICCTGEFTRKIRIYQGMEKEYTGSFILGAVTPTYDLESEPIDFRSLEAVTEEGIRIAASQFLGEQLQVPPAHSAVKRNGKPIYKLARKGIEVRPDPRAIQIKEFEITSWKSPELEFRVVCSTGTYIRSLANDFGRVLGCGAYLGSLCRTRIGAFSLDQALTIEEFVRQMEELAGKDQKG